MNVRGGDLMTDKINFKYEQYCTKSGERETRDEEGKTYSGFSE